MPEAQIDAGKLPEGYVYLRQCGEGAFGKVWLVRDLAQRLLVLKMIFKQPGSMRELDGVRAFCNLNSNCQNLVRIYHTGENEHFFFYTMPAADNLNSTLEEYLPKTLENLLCREKLTPETTRKIALLLLDGLEVLHQAGLVHRDIKPANIFFLDGVPCLGDVGLVGGRDDPASLMGTLHFLPPEVLKQDGGKLYGEIYLPEYDLYALGKVMYCMLTGLDVGNFPIFRMEDASDTRFAALNKMIQRLCAPEHALRLKDAGRLKVLLLQLGRSPGQHWKIRQRGGFAVGLLGLLLAGSALVWGLWKTHDPVRSEPAERPRLRPPVVVESAAAAPGNAARASARPSPRIAPERWEEALEANDPKLLRQMLQQGMAPDTMPENWQQTPLFYAIREHKPVEFLTLLLDAGASFSPLSEKNNALNTALSHHAPGNVIRLLAARAPDINQVNSEMRRTALFLAAQDDYAEALRILINCGAKADWQDVWGQTALFKSVQHGWRKATEALLEAGANPAVADLCGANALH
ncbi:MAG: ankyrin repeat domain-containing protein, partial [Victivallaceae bacterium]|nr:ankyrin repeat domain-containing protein [Victivallaceae bacterium]